MRRIFLLLLPLGIICWVAAIVIGLIYVVLRAVIADPVVWLWTAEQRHPTRYSEFFYCQPNELEVRAPAE